MPQFTVMGIEEVYDAFDDYEHSNRLPPMGVTAISIEEAMKEGEHALKNYIEETRKGFWSSGWFTPQVVQVVDEDGYLVFEDRQAWKRTGIDEDYLVPLIPELRIIQKKLRSCFLSYNSKNEDFANYIYQKLKERHYACWYAPIAPEMTKHQFEQVGFIKKKLAEAISITRLFLVALSRESVASPWVQFEVQTALTEEQRQGNARVIGLAIEPPVTKRQWIQELINRKRILDFSEWKNSSRFVDLLDSLTLLMNQCFEA